MRKNNFILKIIRFMGWIVVFFFRTITIDLMKNIKKAYLYSFNEEERDKIKREIETEKSIKLLKEKLQRIERLVYSIFKDPKYSESDKGNVDLTELKKEINK